MNIFMTFIHNFIPPYDVILLSSLDIVSIDGAGDKYYYSIRENKTRQ